MLNDFYSTSEALSIIYVVEKEEIVLVYDKVGWDIGECPILRYSYPG